MALVIKTEAGYLAKGTDEYTWSFYNARRFKSLDEALKVRELLNVEYATVIRTRIPLHYRRSSGISVFPEPGEGFEVQAYDDAVFTRLQQAVESGKELP